MGLGVSMSDLRKAAQQALEALEIASRNGSDGLKRYELKELDDTIANLRAALAQPEPTRSQQMRDAGYTRRPRQLPKEDEQEPVAWKVLEGTGVSYLSSELPHPSVVAACAPLYTRLPQRNPLTEEEIYKLFGYDNQYGVVPKYAISFVRAVEAAHGIS